MSLRTFVLSLAVGSLMLGVASFGGCGDDTQGVGGGGGEGATPDISGVVFDMEGGDEALIEVLSADVVDNAAEAAVLDAPEADAVVPASPPFTFSWHTGPTASLEPAPMKFGERLGGKLSDPVEELLDLAFGGIRVAHAHGPPVSGRAYFLVLSTDADPTLLRVFTLAKEYTPTSSDWDRIKAAGAPITATILSAELETNSVIQGGGPWVSAPVVFTVASE